MKSPKKTAVHSPAPFSGALDDRQLCRLLADPKRFRMEAKKASLEAWRPHIHWHGFLPSAGNMGAYIGLRRHDLRNIQSPLAALGLSSLGRTEGHVLANLDAVIYALGALIGKPVDAEKILATAQSFSAAGQHLAMQTDRLFGHAPKHRTVRIMVTFPDEAASDYVFVRELVRRGMDCARINCAHDTPEAWKKWSGSCARRNGKPTAAERAECIMLNKGPFVLDAIDVLDRVVARMQSHQQKEVRAGAR